MCTEIESVCEEIRSVLDGSSKAVDVYGYICGNEYAQRCVRGLSRDIEIKKWVCIERAYSV